MPPEGQLSDHEIATVKTFLVELSKTPLPDSWNKPAQVIDKAAVPSGLSLPSNLDATLAIDVAISAQWASQQLTPAPIVDDTAFARKVYLDLIGRIPTRDELAQFQSQSVSHKKELLVDQLLSSPEFATHFAEVMNALLIGRKEIGPIRQARKAGWFDYLENALRSDRPWNLVAREILLARPQSQQEQGAVWYLYSRKGNNQEIAEAVSRDFFGVRIDCAQCHDHPLAAEIEQRHYWGLAAFFNRGSNVETPNGLRVAESAIGGFAEFANLRGNSSANELVFLGRDVVTEPRPAKDAKEEDRDELYIPSSEGEPRVPKFSRREKFVDVILKDHPLVAQAMVNRLWGWMMGRGLVHPIDSMDSFHPASHPELLSWLSRDFERSNYSIKYLLKKIALSKPYQLKSSADPTLDPKWFAAAIAKPLTAEMLYRSMLTALQIQGSEDLNQLEKRLEFALTFPDVLAEESLANVSQGLFLSNGEWMANLVRTSHSQLLDTLMKETDDKQVVEQLFLTLYQRSPDAEEYQHVVSYLKQDDTASRQTKIERIAWALLTSAEFRFNH